MALLTANDTAVFEGIRRLISTDLNSDDYPDSFFISDTVTHPDVQFVELSVLTRIPTAGDLTGAARDKLRLALQYEIAAALLEGYQEPVQESYFQESVRYSERQSQRQIAAYRANAETLLQSLETPATPQQSGGIYPDNTAMLQHLGRLPTLRTADDTLLGLYLQQGLAAYGDKHPATAMLTDVAVPDNRRYTLPAVATGIDVIRAGELRVSHTFLRLATGPAVDIGDIERPSWDTLVAPDIGSLAASTAFGIPARGSPMPLIASPPDEVDITYFHYPNIGDLDAVGQLAVQCYVEARFYEESVAVPEQAAQVARADVTGTSNKLAAMRLQLAKSKMAQFKQLAAQQIGFRSESLMPERIR